jgi:DNA-binding response OmpR family regulator
MMEKIKLLFVEDDASFAFIIKETLELHGKYEVQVASNGKEGLEIYESFCPDVIVSDIEMPVLSGMEMIEKVRQKDELIPILFATGHINPRDVLDGYQLNIDNFIKKPYLPEELDAHIMAILKRLRISLVPLNKDAIALGEYIFYYEHQKLCYKDEVFKLTGREAKILWKLCEQKGQILNRDNLLTELWGASDFFTSRSLDVFINSLRKFLSKDPKIKIETIRGKGLQLIIS